MLVKCEERRKKHPPNSFLSVHERPRLFDLYMNTSGSVRALFVRSNERIYTVQQSQMIQNVWVCYQCVTKEKAALSAMAFTWSYEFNKRTHSSEAIYLLANLYRYFHSQTEWNSNRASQTQIDTVASKSCQNIDDFFFRILKKKSAIFMFSCGFLEVYCNHFGCA